MAARLDAENTQSMRQSLHHLVAKAPWSDDVLLEQVRNYVLPAMQKHGPVVAWIVDDTGFPKKGKHSVGVTRQYCGQVGKQENCRVAVSLSVATWSSSLPVEYRLYLPKEWVEDAERREKTEVPKEIEFRPSRRSRWTRSVRRSRQIWAVAWCWLMRLTGPTRNFATGSPNWTCSMWWVCRVR
jgi:SRSO17 transposase